MNKQDKLFRKIETKEDHQSYLSKLYSDLTNAINSKDFQSIWEHSKIVTKYRKKYSTRLLFI